MTLHPRVLLVPCVGRGISTFSVQIVVSSVFKLVLSNSFLVLRFIPKCGSNFPRTPSHSHSVVLVEFEN